MYKNHVIARIREKTREIKKVNKKKVCHGNINVLYQYNIDETL